MNIKYAVTSKKNDSGWEVIQDYDFINQLPKKIGEDEFYEAWEEIKGGYKVIGRGKLIDHIKQGLTA